MFSLPLFFSRYGQSKATGVVVDFTEPSSVYDNVKQVVSLTVLNMHDQLTKLRLHDTGSSIRFKKCSVRAKASVGCGKHALSIL